VLVLGKPGLYLTPAQKYMFRHPSLHHMRIEQVVRYYSTVAGSAREAEAAEDTVVGDDAAVDIDTGHRHYDKLTETIPAGSKYPAFVKGLETLSRRHQGRLGVSRCVYWEPLGPLREKYFQQDSFFL
jgi:hypothetical protein